LNLDSRIGEKAGPYSEEVTPARVEAFAKAVGAPLDGSVPPTYPTRFRKGEFELSETLGLPLSRVLHAEQAYEYVSPIEIGDTVTFETTLARAVEKSGSSGSMTFVVLETRVRAAATGKECAVGCTTIVVRGGDAQ
jgi:hypothetical protein